MSFFSDALRRVGGALGIPVAEVEALVDDAVARAEDIVRATGSRVAGRILDAVEAAVPGIPVEEIAGDVSDTIASEVDGTSCACLSSCAMPIGAPATVTSGRSSRRARSV